MTVPTIGRIVYYYSTIAQVNPNAAVVCHVRADERDDGQIRHFLNLAGFSEKGHPFNREDIPLIQADQDRPNGEHCTWMPYQIEQAAKASAPAIITDPTASPT